MHFALNQDFQGQNCNLHSKNVWQGKETKANQMMENCCSLENSQRRNHF
jgi:hypothetical protein